MQFALFWITARRAAVCTGKAWAKGHHGLKGLETHRAVSPARQDPEVVDFAVQLQPAGNGEVEEERGEVLKVLHSSCLTEPLAFTKPHPCLPPELLTAVGKATVTLASPALVEEEWGVHRLRTHK